MAETISEYALCSLDEAKRYLQRTSTTSDDDMINRCINYVTGQIERFCRRRLMQRVYDLDPTDAPVAGHALKLILNGHGSAEIFLPEYPVASVTKIETLLGDAITYRTLNITGYRVSSRGILQLWYDYMLEGFRNTRVTCTAGIPPFPGPISGSTPAGSIGVEDWKALT